MAGRKPGPLCGLTDSPIDTGTLCRNQSPLPGPIGAVDHAKAGVALEATRKAALRLSENAASLRNKNVIAFLSAIAAAEGGDYNLKFGGVKGKKNDKWQFTDTSTHPGTGSDRKTTAAGMYQINKATWHEMGAKMGLTDFSNNTQDLLAVEILRTIRVLDHVSAGDVDTALSAASRRWAALPQGPEKPGRYAQPYMNYDDFVAAYRKAGGMTK